MQVAGDLAARAVGSFGGAPHLPLNFSLGSTVAPHAAHVGPRRLPALRAEAAVRAATVTACTGSGASREPP